MDTNKLNLQLQRLATFIMPTKNWVIITTIFSISTIVTISFILNNLWRKNFGNWALNLLVITISLSPLLKVYNKYVKIFLLHQFNNTTPKELIKNISIKLNRALIYRRHLGILTFQLGFIHGASYILSYGNMTTIPNSYHLIL